MSACKFPEHHASGSGGSAAGVITGAVALAVTVTVLWHAALLLAGVITGLAVTALAVRALIRSGRSAPYDTAWHDQDQAAGPAQAFLAARVAQLERQLADRQPASPAIEPAAVHQHLHLHGLDAAAMAAVITSQHGRPAGLPAITTGEDQP